MTGDCSSPELSGIDMNCTPNNSSLQNSADIGVLFQNGINPRTLSNTQKLNIISTKIDTTYNYPTTYMNGCNRKFQAKWSSLYPWIHYSKDKNGVFCKACVLFAPEKVNYQSLGVLVTTLFRIWTSISSALHRHNKSQYDQDSMVKMDSFKYTSTNYSASLTSRLSKEREERIKCNTEVIKSLFECVIFLGKQGLSYRGHRDDSTYEGVINAGNFIECVYFRVQTDGILANHLKAAPKIATYLSKTIQNDFIQIVGNTVRNKIISDIKSANFFLILADEVTDCSNQEQLSLAIRFVDSEGSIREEFMDFVSVDRITGEVLSSAILARLQSWDIPITNCRGQGYDGASNMSSSVCGVQGRIQQHAPLAFYTHCQAHQLNLCVVKACGIPDIRNANSVISEIAKFFNYSPKRQHFFEYIISQNSVDRNISKLKKLCKTRWIERIDAYATFFELYPSIISTLEFISSRNDSNWSWDTDTHQKANGFLHQITSFKFLMAASITMRLLSVLRGITVKLQSCYRDILMAHELVSDVHLELHLLKLNCEEEFHKWYTEITGLGTSLNIAVSMPRITQRQVHRANVPSDNPETYYRRTIMLPFVDHVLSEMDNRFSETHKKIIILLALVPSIIAVTDSFEPIEELARIYCGDLHTPSLIRTEWQRWKQKWTITPITDRPSELTKALQSCDADIFPNIKVLLCIACTLLVTVCENERSNSQIKKLKTYLRCTMSSQRLSALAMMKMHQKNTKENKQRFISTDLCY